MNIPIYYNKVINIIYEHFNHNKQNYLQSIGLNKAYKDFLCNKILSFNDIIQLEYIFNNQDVINLDVFLTNYITENNKIIKITLLSIINNLYNKVSIPTYFRRNIYHLHIYNKPFCVLPECIEGKFYTRGFVYRVWNVDIDTLPILESYRINRIILLLCLNRFNFPNDIVKYIYSISKKCDN